MKLAYKYMAIFFNFQTTSNHLHPLQVGNCDSNSRLVVYEDGNVKSGLTGLTLEIQAKIPTSNDPKIFIHHVFMKIDISQSFLIN